LRGFVLRGSRLGLRERRGLHVHRLQLRRRYRSQLARLDRFHLTGAAMFDRDHTALRIGRDHFEVRIAFERGARPRHLCARVRRCDGLGFRRFAIASSERERCGDGEPDARRKDARKLSGHNSLHGRLGSILTLGRARVHSSLISLH
jgi:hypothetical protein